MKIYTKSGDDGSTSLSSGNRTSKCADRVQLYGGVDELNSHIGVLVATVSNDENLRDSSKAALDQMSIIQHSLFALGAEFAADNSKALERIQKKIVSQDTTNLESWIDQMEEKLPPLTNFILPGGSQAGALAHVCRTSVRRVERDCIAFEMGRSEVRSYINRLSDYFFVLSRQLNQNLGIKDILWKNN